MIRALLAPFLALALVAASLLLAEARGASHDIGRALVICSGVGMKTITLGLDGAPVETTEPCPYGTSIFAASFSLPPMPRPVPRLLALVAPPAAEAPAPQRAPSPAARGPPALA